MGIQSYHTPSLSLSLCLSLCPSPQPCLDGGHQGLGLLEVLGLKVGDRRRLKVHQPGLRAQLTDGLRRPLVGQSSEALHVLVGFVKGSVLFLCGGGKVGVEKEGRKDRQTLTRQSTHERISTSPSRTCPQSWARLAPGRQA